MYFCITLGVLWNNFVSAKEERIVGMGHCEVEYDNKDTKTNLELYMSLIYS